MSFNPFGVLWDVSSLQNGLVSLRFQKRRLRPTLAALAWKPAMRWGRWPAGWVEGKTLKEFLRFLGFSLRPKVSRVFPKA